MVLKHLQLRVASVGFSPRAVRYAALRTQRTQCINFDRFLLNKLSVCGRWRPRSRALLRLIGLLHDGIPSDVCLWTLQPAAVRVSGCVSRYSPCSDSPWTDRWSPYWFHFYFPVLSDFRPTPDYNFHLCVYHSLSTHTQEQAQAWQRVTVMTSGWHTLSSGGAAWCLAPWQSPSLALCCLSPHTLEMRARVHTVPI